MKKRVINRKADLLKSERGLMKFKYRETGENWNGPTMMELFDIACYIVNYMGHVLFQQNYRINQSYLAFHLTGYVLSPLLLQRSQQSRGHTQSTMKFDNSDLFC